MKGRNSAFAVALTLAATITVGAEVVAAADVSTLKPGDALVLMPAAAHQSADGREWIVPLHAWVYVPQKSVVRRTAIEKLLELRYGLKPSRRSAPYLEARINLLLADNKRGREVVVDVGGQRVTLPPTGANGHAVGEVRIAVSAGAPADARLPVRAVLAVSDRRRIETTAHLVGPRGVSVISDIDDTVKVTHVTNRRRMWEATFFKPFVAVDGMAALYGRIGSKAAVEGVAFHYVSSSPWHFATPLLEFLSAGELPVSSIALKQIRLKDRSALDIVRPGRETKPPQIASILARYPQRRFILIGDSGEDDPEIYAAALRNNPGQIDRVLIRNVTGATRDDARFRTAFQGIDPARWMLFDEAAQAGIP